MVLDSMSISAISDRNIKPYQYLNNVGSTKGYEHNSMYSGADVDTYRFIGDSGLENLTQGRAVGFNPFNPYPTVLDLALNRHFGPEDYEYMRKNDGKIPVSTNGWVG